MQNFPLPDNFIDNVLQTRPIQNTCLSGRILQLKALVVSKFVYLFQLLLTPSKSKFLEPLDKILYEYLWEGGRHRMAKNKMFAPKKLGGFNMIDIYCQEKLLKLSWIAHLLSDTLQISVWQDYICSAFLIPIVDVLKCNFSYTHYKRLLVMKIPKVWEDIF